jgi:hypothetical protein
MVEFFQQNAYVDFPVHVISLSGIPSHGFRQASASGNTHAFLQHTVPAGQGLANVGAYVKF